MLSLTWIFLSIFTQRAACSSVFLVALVSFATPANAAAEHSPLATALASKNILIRRVVEKSDQYELQVLLTVLEGHSIETTIRHQYRLDTTRYFYPASTVKLPIAMLAAEFISRHPALTLETPYSLGEGDEHFSIGKDIQFIFAISDDDAYNRLYEIVGRDYANQRLAQLGYRNSRIAHRLAVPNADNAQRQQVHFHTDNGIVTFEGSDQAVTPLEIDGLQKGKGHIKDGEMIPEPFDFRFKNYFSLEDQHQLLADFVFEPDTGFDLGEVERAFLLNTMRLTPATAGFQESEYFDGYGKFFLFGDTRDPIPEHIKIYNKVGYAYGTLTDNAYIADEENGVSFLLSATILVNQNEIFNDDTYEYDAIGLPFLAQLGREIYQHLLQQNLNTNE